MKQAVIIIIMITLSALLMKNKKRDVKQNTPNDVHVHMAYHLIMYEKTKIYYYNNKVKISQTNIFLMDGSHNKSEDEYIEKIAILLAPSIKHRYSKRNTINNTDYKEINEILYKMIHEYKIAFDIYKSNITEQEYETECNRIIDKATEMVENTEFDDQMVYQKSYFIANK